VDFHEIASLLSVARNDSLGSFAIWVKIKTKSQKQNFMSQDQEKSGFRAKYLMILAGIVIVLDFGLTVVGQSQSYWRDYNQVNELNPIAEYFLKIHPAIFIVAIFGYLLFCLLLVCILKKPLNLILTLFLLLCHSWGALSWMVILCKRWFPQISWYGTPRWYLILIYYALIGVLSGIFIYKSFRKSSDY